MKMGRSFLVKLLVFLNLLAVIGLLCSYAAGYISPDKYWIFGFFGLAYPIFLIINFFFVILWMILWKKFVFISLITILAGWNTLQSFFPIHLSKQRSTAGLTLKIVSFNVHHFYGTQRAESIPETRSKIIEFLSKQDADIICVQEFFALGDDFSETFKKFAKSISMEYFSFKNYKDFYNKRKIVAIATFSHHPIVNSGYFQLQDRLLYATFSDLVIKGDTIRIYNLHLESIRFGNDDYSFYAQFTDPDKEVAPLGEGSKRMISKLRKSFILRSKQVHLLSAHIANCPYPVLLTGDFNDTPSSYTYHQLTAGLSDAYKEAGNGFFEGTYSGKLPSFRIDYILHSSEFQPLEYRKIEVGLSDHYPVSTTLVFNH
jgi:endonuclease/exonuclease/phosphatase family metal-dependent hydrolase